jgi:hypothetical protein
VDVVVVVAAVVVVVSGALVLVDGSTGGGAVVVGAEVGLIPPMVDAHPESTAIPTRAASRSRVIPRMSAL